MADPRSESHPATSEAFLALLTELGLDDGSTAIVRLVTRLAAPGDVSTLEVKFQQP
jgi:hypothetical protein